MRCASPLAGQHTGLRCAGGAARLRSRAKAVLPAPRRSGSRDRPATLCRCPRWRGRAAHQSPPPVTSPAPARLRPAGRQRGPAGSRPPSAHHPARGRHSASHRAPETVSAGRWNGLRDAQTVRPSPPTRRRTGPYSRPPPGWPTACPHPRNSARGARAGWQIAPPTRRRPRASAAHSLWPCHRRAGSAGGGRRRPHAGWARAQLPPRSQRRHAGAAHGPCTAH